MVNIYSETWWKKAKSSFSDKSEPLSGNVSCRVQCIVQSWDWGFNSQLPVWRLRGFSRVSLSDLCVCVWRIVSPVCALRMVNSKRLHSTPLLTSKFSKYEGWPYSAVYVNSMAFSHYCRFTPSSTVGKPTLQDPTSPAFPFPTTAPFLHHVEVWRVVWFSQNETFKKKNCY